MVLIFQFVPILALVLFSFGVPMALGYVLHRRDNLARDRVLPVAAAPAALIAAVVFAMAIAGEVQSAAGQGGLFALGLGAVSLFVGVLFFSSGMTFAGVGVRLAVRRERKHGNEA
jgi:hypothetical protein